MCGAALRTGRKLFPSLGPRQRHGVFAPATRPAASHTSRETASLSSPLACSPISPSANRRPRPCVETNLLIGVPTVHLFSRARMGRTSRLFRREIQYTLCPCNLETSYPSDGPQCRHATPHASNRAVRENFHQEPGSGMSIKRMMATSNSLFIQQPHSLRHLAPCFPRH